MYIYSIGYWINITVYLLLHLESFHYRMSGFYKQSLPANKHFVPRVISKPSMKGPLVEYIAFEQYYVILQLTMMFWCLFSVIKHFIILPSLNKDRCIDTDSDTEILCTKFQLPHRLGKKNQLLPLSGWFLKRSTIISGAYMHW